MRLVSRSLFLFLFAVSAFAADISDYWLAKGRHYFQLSETRVDIQTNNAYRFSLILDNVAPNSIVSARVGTPSGGGINAVRDADGSPWRVRERFDFPFDLENNYPNGTFTLTIVGATDGQRVLSLPITGDQYPNPPRLIGYEAAQAVPINAYKRFTWDPFIGGTRTDFVQFAIEDLNNNTVFETPDYGEEGALTGLDRGCVIPPGTLRVGREYFATIRFVKVLSSGSPAYPGVIGYSGYFTRTEFTVRAVDGPTRGAIDSLQVWKTRRLQYSQGILGEDNRPWTFRVSGRAPAENMIHSGSITMPSPAGTRVFTVDPTRREFEYEFDQSTSETALNNAYPNGAYTTEIIRMDHLREVRQFNFPASTFPQAPNLQNLSAYTNFRAENQLVISWAPWVGAGELDFIRVELEDADGVELFDTPSYVRDDYLRATATQTVVPVGLLVPGRSYQVTVTFFKVTLLDLATAPAGIIYGGFATRTALNFTTASPDVLSASVGIGQRVWQRDDTTFEADPARAGEFTAMTIASAPGAVTSMSVRAPTGASAALDPIGVTNIFSATDATYAGIAARFPAGDYRFNAQTAHDGARAFNVALSSTVAPPIPRIRNLSRLQVTRLDVANTILWDAWTGADTNTDFIVVTVENSAGSTLSGISSAAAGQPNALLGTNTTFTIPAQGLTANNRSFTVRVRFERLLRLPSMEYAGAEERSSVFSETSFYISTMTPSSLRIASPTFSNNTIQFTVTAPLSNRTYRIDTSPDMIQWFQGQTYSTARSVNIPIQLEAPAQFYRLILLP